MIIVADQAIPSVTEAFSPLGELKLVDGRRLSAADLQRADALLVRSVTRVDAALLDDTPVRFVGTATSGTDHIDMVYLNRRRIGFANAAGCNAQAVTEYVIAAMLELSRRQDTVLQNKTLGIVGYGHVGRALAVAARGFGLRVIVNDPPLENAAGQFDIRFHALDELLQQSDIVSLHVPLLKQGFYPTWHMVDERFLALMKPSAWLINSARGAVVDSDALLAFLQQGGIAVVDVWEGEPDLSPALLEAASIATPHVAGYSQDAKLNATKMLHAALSRFFGLTQRWQLQLPAPGAIVIDDPDMALIDAVRQTYDINTDDMHMRAALRLPAAKRPAYFDSLRTAYNFRREFAAWSCGGKPGPGLRAALARLGFRLGE